ncbi:DegV family protein [Clostridium sp. DJ247]|uniref:DegV family protein n=1 Tax=Clostridium sp. DJ247 TaxID=2726188 RepID=UPI0016256BBA|nr:DegV family protein [Clostridium sp. DJ247]MBC2582071.1 DegV family protein [Clostridium sp. DJ247]
MNKIKIITDSTADLPKDIIDKYNIEVLPLLVNFGEDTYRDGIDINLHELLKKIKAGPYFPTTSQVNPQAFIECYDRYLKQGYKIISIHLSSKLSGTYQSACIAKETLETEDIVVIDSLNATAGVGLLVIKAAKLREQGLELLEIHKEIKELIPHVKSAIAFDTLDNLVKGGRLSKTAGVVGNMLGIKPIIAVENGEVIIKNKVRGSKKAIRTILDYIENKGIKENETTALLHVENKDILGSLREELVKRNGNFIEVEAGCVIGVHAGEGACGLFFIEDH